MYVVVYIAEDGTVSVWGTPDGQALSARQTADKVAKWLLKDADPMQAQANVYAIQ